MSHLDPHALELARAVAVVVGGDHHGPSAGPDRPADQAAGAFGQHHPDQVVARKEERLLERAGRDDDPLRAEAEEQLTRVHGDEATFVDAERPRRRDLLDPRSDGQSGLLKAFVDEDDLAPRSCGLVRGRASRAARADHEHVGPPVLDVVAPRPAAVPVDLAEAGDVAQESLVQRPRAARPDHRPVVEPDGRERPAHLVDDGERIPLQGAEHVLGTDARAVAGGLRADPDVRNAVDAHQAVRTSPSAAEEAPGTVVLEAAGEDAAAPRKEGRADRVPLERGDRGTVEEEGERLTAVDPLAGLRWQSHQTAGVSGTAAPRGAGPPAGRASSVVSTSFVRVSRSA